MMDFAPKSSSGKWAVGLIVTVPILLYIGMTAVRLYSSVPAGRTILEDIIARPGVALPMLSGFVCGIAASLCGIIGITRKKDHALPTVMATILGLVVLAWVLAEILFPH